MEATSPSTPPPEAWEPLQRLARLVVRPLERFLRIEAASGIVLLLATAIALVWSNSPWGSTYTALWHTPLGVIVGPLRFERSLEWVVNDVLMVLFFFVVGMEIRREVNHGELSEWRRAALPAAAALGGMVAPAVIYLAIGGRAATRSGWGVPMATDIAFAVGILTLLGKRVPPALRVLLLALAVIDDIGAIVVIAVFYSSKLALSGVLVTCAGVGAIFVMQRLGVRAKVAYVGPGIVVWAGVYATGIHPTVAGVLVGLLTPVRAWLGPAGFAFVRDDVERLARAASEPLSPHDLAVTLHRVDVARRAAMSPAESLIETLHPWVAFGIMPIFALANAGVPITGVSLRGDALAVGGGVMIGLVVGKPVGVLSASALAMRLRLASLPAGIGRRHLAVLGVVAGVGFTMSIFVAQLAFSNAALLAVAKLGVLVASGVAAALALALGRGLPMDTDQSRVARTADEAEASTEL
ncbi:MAG: Na+/H+ antiporter NhaA [Myxococcales bacterium]|jgi:NhaA family Na+:H+ antiporter|nr:Na+/H+ antiporter NhaA [Myxococcales bacterium]